MVLILSLLAACSGEVNGAPEPPSAPERRIATGRRLIASYGCGSCHSIPYRLAPKFAYEMKEIDTALAKVL